MEGGYLELIGEVSVRVKARLAAEEGARWSPSPAAIIAGIDLLCDSGRMDWSESFPLFFSFLLN